MGCSIPNVHSWVTKWRQPPWEVNPHHSQRYPEKFFQIFHLKFRLTWFMLTRQTLRWPTGFLAISAFGRLRQVSLPPVMDVLHGPQVFTLDVSGVLLAVGNREVLALDVCIIFAYLKSIKLIKGYKSLMRNLLMQWTAVVSSNLFRQTLQNLLLWCIGSDQQWATGFLIIHGATPEHGVTTFVTHFSCTMKLQTVESHN